MLLFSFLPRGRNFFQLIRKNRDFFHGYPFQKFLRFTYSTYAKNLKSLTLFSKNFSTSGSIFPEFPKSFRFTQKKLPDSTYAESLQPFTLFAKNLPHRVYFQNFWNRYRFSGLFFKNLSLADRVSPFQQYPMRQFAKFAKITLYRGYFQNHHYLRSSFLTFFKKTSHLHWCYRKNTPKRSHHFWIFSKNYPPHHWLSVFHPRNVAQFSKKMKNFYFLTFHITDLELFLSHFRLKSKLQRSVLHSPSTEVISKTTPRCVATFGKNSEKHHLPPRTIAITPLFCNTLFHLFSKIFVSPLLTITFLPRKGHTCSKNFSKKTPHCWLSHFFCVLFLHSWKKVEKSYRSGIKS